MRGKINWWLALFVMGVALSSIFSMEKRGENLRAQRPSAELSGYAAKLQGQLKTSSLPWWHEATLDKTYGGYILADPASPNPAPAEKQLVTQARLIWSFAHAHLHGYSGQRNYLEAAEHGYKFLRDHFYDTANGGYFWKTDLQGRAINTRKIIYGEAFVIYALVELSRASGRQMYLQQAMELFQTLQKFSHDPIHRGWIEHFTADWKPIMSADPDAEVEVPGLKSANAHLHLQEAFTELFQATKDPEVKSALEEALRINKKYFYPGDPGKSCFHRYVNWTPVTSSSSAGLSYGHNVEFAWLMIEAERVLKVKPSWKHFFAHLDHALQYGFDHEQGGLYHRGVGNAPAAEKEKIWWVEAEMLAALCVALEHRQSPAYEKALKKLLDFVVQFQIDPQDGVWLDTVAPDGAPLKTAKAHNWKANYHDFRALVKFIKLFGGTHHGQRVND